MNRAQTFSVSPGAQRGMTLVEIMVAITISLILLAGIIQVFLASKTTYRMQDGLSRVQENGRYAMHFIGQRAREAGFLACSTGQVGSLTNTLNDTGDARWNFDLYVEGYEASGTGPNQTYNVTATNPTAGGASAADWSASSSATVTALPSFLVGSVLPGTDVLIVRSAGPDTIKIDKNNNSSQMFIEQTSKVTGVCADGSDQISGLCAGDVVVATDCTKSRVFQITNLQTTGSGGGSGPGSCATSAACANAVHAGTSSSSFVPGNAISSWGGNSAPPEERFGKGGQILMMKTTAYYIGEGASGAPALFYRENDGAAQELLDNVENMQILYGEDTDAAGSANFGFPNRYVTAAQVTDFKNVISIRISLLMRTPENARTTADTDNYILAGATAATGTTINPFDDRRLRRVYTSTIKLRNMGVR